MASDQLLSLTTVRESSDEDVRAENRRLRALMDAMTRAVPSAAVLVEVLWTEDGRMSYVFCVPGENEAAGDALVKAMFDAGLPRGVAKEIAIEGMRAVLARHGLTAEAKEECAELVRRVVEAAKEEE
jgi:hypothetical protein